MLSPYSALMAATLWLAAAWRWLEYALRAPLAWAARPYHGLATRVEAVPHGRARAWTVLDYTRPLPLLLRALFKSPARRRWDLREALAKLERDGRAREGDVTYVLHYHYHAGGEPVALLAADPRRGMRPPRELPRKDRVVSAYLDRLDCTAHVAAVQSSFHPDEPRLDTRRLFQYLNARTRAGFISTRTLFVLSACMEEAVLRWPPP